MTTRPRLYIEQKLKSGFEFFLLDMPFNYLANVLRLSHGDAFLAFDNENGEFLCEIKNVEKKRLTVEVKEQTRQMEKAPDIWLLFAPVKKDKTDFIIEKSTELGVRKIVPVITKRTISDKVKIERYTSQAIEAAEQCRRVDLPEIANSNRFEDLIKHWDSSRILFFMDETGNGDSIYDIFSQNSFKNRPAAILIGPEGGFEQKELEILRKLDYAVGVSMGQRILRAETAVAASLSCWQALCGDWVASHHRQKL